MKLARWIIYLILLIFIALPIAGCGGDGKTNGSATTSGVSGSGK